MDGAEGVPERRWMPRDEPLIHHCPSMASSFTARRITPRSCIFTRPVSFRLAPSPLSKAGSPFPTRHTPSYP